MHIEEYSGRYDEEIISLILGIQNDEARIDLPLSQQPDLLDIDRCYHQSGGGFWLAMIDGNVVGTIGLMVKERGCAVMKKFFVKKEFRSQKIGLALYNELLGYARHIGIRYIILDTPAVAEASHRFYERAGFRRIDASELPTAYSYPDRNSLLYLLEL